MLSRLERVAAGTAGVLYGTGTYMNKFGTYEFWPQMDTALISAGAGLGLTLGIGMLVLHATSRPHRLDNH